MCKGRSIINAFLLIALGVQTGDVLGARANYLFNGSACSSSCSCAPVRPPPCHHCVDCSATSEFLITSPPRSVLQRASGQAMCSEAMSPARKKSGRGVAWVGVSLGPHWQCGHQPICTYSTLSCRGIMHFFQCGYVDSVDACAHVRNPTHAEVRPPCQMHYIFMSLSSRLEAQALGPPGIRKCSGTLNTHPVVCDTLSGRGSRGWALAFRAQPIR